MLKLEKTSSLTNLTIRWREREHFFEPRLLQAFTIALLLHCGAMLIFHIAPINFSSTFRFPPIQVVSDVPTPALVLIDPLLYDEMGPPPPRFIPTLDWITLPPPLTWLPVELPDRQAFQFLEERLWPSWVPLPPKSLEKPLIEFTFSGELANHSLISIDPLLDRKVPLSAALLSPLYVRYRAQMESTGTLFWYERTLSSGVEAVDHLTETLLQNFRFANPTPEAFLAGEVHFAVFSLVSPAEDSHLSDDSDR